jgi:hypothetical protein
MKYLHTTLWSRIGSVGIVMLLMLAILSACSDDDGPTASNSDPVDAESAILYSFRLETPGGAVEYMDVYSEIPAEPDESKAVELGAGQQIYSFGEHPYVWDGNASTLTRWNVSKTDLSLSISNVMSLASLGISTGSSPIFVSETQAYFFALGEGKVIEFNPSEMTITEVHDVTPFTKPTGANWFGEWFKTLRGNKVIMPLGWYAGPNWEIPNKAQVAVFDITTNQVTYYEDSRLLANNSDVVTDLSDNQTIYIRPAFDNMFAVHYGNHSNYSSPTTVLRLESDGSFDPDFSYDIADAIKGIKVVNLTPFVYGDELIVIAEDSTYNYPEDPADRWGSSPTSQAYKINMETNEVEDFTALSDYDLWKPWTTIDGVSYFWARTDPGGVQHSFLLKQNAIDDYTEVSKIVGGQIREVKRLW